MLVEQGRVCIKKFGRDAGSMAVITSVGQNGYVNIVTSKRQKERKCNARHLEFLNEKVDPKNKDQVNKILGVSSEAPKHK
ncbi:50S ribosomal protein L14e [Candidatus Marsarchaeota archaeon]|jgi:ribosomal protein L14E/L6E/L27E|nr:50S ribosomal protein L14e [Candidatus Marsarchaeota archaeon]